MTEIFTSIYSLFQQVFMGAPSYVTTEICQWLAVASCFFVISVPFIFIVKIIKLLVR